MREVDLGTFVTAHAEGATVIDVREPYEYVSGHVPGAELLPLGNLPQQAGRLPRTGKVYVICARGNRSLTAADYLATIGVTAYSVAGGTGAWIRAGHPVVRGDQPS
ncbi:MAG TPA: rhodanese-like domain-containing protein [Micromonosporaceae bacterium]